MWRKAKYDSEIETECIFGDWIEIIINEGKWKKCKNLSDNYIGWIYGNPFGDVQKNNYKVVTIRSFTYSKPNIKTNQILCLTMGSKILVEDIQNDWAQVTFRKGKNKIISYILLKHIRKTNEKVNDWVSTAEKMIGIPYRWGGKNTIGIDCSALVQIALQSVNFNAPRNSGSQINMALPKKKKNEPFYRGMIVFWKGHVGIMTDQLNIIHANAYHMKVYKEPLSLVKERMGKMKIEKVLVFQR